MFLLQKYSRHKFIEVKSIVQSFLNIEADAFSKKRESEGRIFLTPYGIGNNKV